MNRIGVSALALSVGIVGAVQPVFAQSSTEAAAPQAEGGADVGTSNSGDIIVTANRREQRLQDVPATVTAVTNQEIATLKLLQVEDVEKLSPGLQLDKGSTGYSATIGLRGTSWDTNSGALPVVDFYFDDVVTPPNFAFQAMYDIGQIEVLRGPQGTLRGRPSPTGAITIVTARPDLTQHGGYAQLTATSLGGMNGQGAINLPLIEDRLGIRVSGLVDRTEANGVRSFGNGKDPYSETNAVRGSIRAQPTDTLDIRLTYDHIEADFSLYNPVVGPGAGYNGPVIASLDRRAVAERPEATRQNIEMASLQIKQELPFGADLIYVGGFQNIVTNSSTSVDPGRAILNLDLAQGVFAEEEYWSHELRLQAIGPVFDYVVGAYHNKSAKGVTLVTIEVPLSGAFGPPGSFTGPANPAYVLNGLIDIAAEGSSRALFANATWHATDRLDIQGGVRYNIIKKADVITQSFAAARNAFINPVPFPCIFLGPGIAASPYPGSCDALLPAGATTLPRALTSKPWTYDASVRYEITPDVNVYARLGHSFRQGQTNVGLQVGSPPSPILAPLVYSTPETSNSYEAGIKAALMDRRLRVNLSVFQQDFKDYLNSFTNINTRNPNSGAIGPTPALTYNVDARVRGVEGEMSFKASENWDVSIVAAYATSKIKNQLVPCNNAAVPLTAANPINFCTSNAAISDLPKFSSTVQSEVRMPLGENQAYLRGLANYRGKAVNPNTLFRTNDFVLLDLFAGLRIGDQADISLFAKNLLNTQQELNRNAVPFGSVAGVASGYRGTMITARREFGVSARFQFGSR